MSINIWKLDYFLCENSKSLIIECLNIYFALKCNEYLYELIYLSRDICILDYILIFISHWCGVAHSVKCILCGVAPSRESVLHCVVWPTVFCLFLWCCAQWLKCRLCGEASCISWDNLAWGKQRFSTTNWKLHCTAENRWNR